MRHGAGECSVGDRSHRGRCLAIAPWPIAPDRMALRLYLLYNLLGVGTLDELGLLQGPLLTTEISDISLLACAVSAGIRILCGRYVGLGSLEHRMRWVAKR